MRRRKFMAVAALAAFSGCSALAETEWSTLQMDTPVGVEKASVQDDREAVKLYLADNPHPLQYLGFAEPNGYATAIQLPPDGVAFFKSIADGEHRFTGYDSEKTELWSFSVGLNGPTGPSEKADNEDK